MEFTRADRKLAKLGFGKYNTDEEKESKYGVSFGKTDVNNGGYHRIDIIHKANGEHLIQSYQEGINSDGFNNCVGLTYKEMKAVMRKYREMKRKYRWE